MNKLKYTILGAVIALLGLHTSCKDGFSEMNTNPESLPNVEPQELFYMAQIQTQTSGHLWNGNWASKTRWLQYGRGTWGYNLTQYTYFSSGIGNTMYDAYNEMGSYVAKMNLLASKKADAENYTNLLSTSRILLIAKAIQVSDSFGSLAYSDAWKGQGMENPSEADLKPKFQTQEELVEIWDKELKEAIAALKGVSASTTQISLKGIDRSYNGDTKKWIKAANGIRLRLASRLWNRMPAKALEIASEVLRADNAEYVFASNDDNFILWFDNLYTTKHGGDWHSSRDMLAASKSMVDYCLKYQDPRLRIFYVKNHLTPARVAEYNAAQDLEVNKIPVEMADQPFVGVLMSPDKLNRTDNPAYYGSNFTFADGTIYNMSPKNTAQSRIWYGGDNVGVGNGEMSNGNGGNWAPVMSYADFCFLAAEFVQREKVASAKNAQAWYETGVRASLDFWNTIGKYSDVLYYEPISEDEIENFMEQPDIKWNAAKAVEQIRTQAYLDHYKNVDEAYAQWKRTGYPSVDGTIMIREQVYIDKIERFVPRRAAFVQPTPDKHNYDNLRERLETMKKDPQFGDENDEFGRVWWDYPATK